MLVAGKTRNVDFVDVSQMFRVVGTITRTASAEQREVLMRFFKTGRGQYGEGDKFLGVKVPQVRSVVKKYAAECPLGEVEELIASPFHEIRLAAILILCRKFLLAKDRPAEQEVCFGMPSRNSPSPCGNAI